MSRERDDCSDSRRGYSSGYSGDYSSGYGIRYAPVIAFAGSFVAFLMLAAPTVTWMDAGELAAAGFTLGGAHPPGHPVHSLLVKLMSLVPLGDIAFRANMLSAVAMAAAVSGVVALVVAIVPRSGFTGYLCALMVVGSPLVQTNATRTEVYGPVAALLVWAVYAAVRLGKQYSNEQQPNAPMGPLVCAFSCGLAAAIHPLIAVAVTLPLSAWLLFRLRVRILRLAWPLVFLGLLGLAVYAYLPVRSLAETKALFMWGDAGSWDGFLNVLSAPAYQGNFSFNDFGSRFVDLFTVLADGIGVAILISGLVGVCFGAVSSLYGAGLLLICATAVVAGAATQQAANPDMAGYVVLAQLFLAPGAAIFASAVVRTVLPTTKDQRLIVVAGLVAMAPLFAIGVSAQTNRVRDAGARRGYDVHTLVDETVGAMAPGPAIYFANGDHSLFASLYSRLVAGYRPDVAIANADLCRDEWFLRFVKQQLPALHVPYVDDGKRGQTAERLAIAALRGGLPVSSDTPTVAKLGSAVKFAKLGALGVRPQGRGYQLSIPAVVDPVSPPERPLAFRGDTGRRVSGYIALTRALYEIGGRRLGGAVIAAGLDRRFEALASIPADVPEPPRPSLFSLVPTPPVLLFEPWQADLLADDIAWLSGLAERPLGRSPTTPRILHRLWRRLLDGEITPESPDFAALSFSDQLATAQAMVRIGQVMRAERLLAVMRTKHGEREAALLLLGSIYGNQGPESTRRAEALFRRVTEIAPNNVEAFARLGIALAKQQRFAEARAAWQAAQRLDSSRTDIRAWLKQLPPEL